MAKRKRLNGHRTVSYLRVSTAEQSTKKNRAEVLEFCNRMGFSPVEFVEDKVSGRKPYRERKVGKLLDELKAGDRVITPELSRLGRSTLDTLTLLKEFRDRGIAVYSLKESLSLNGDEDVMSKVMVTVLSMVSELESYYISKRVREGMKAAKASGKKMGRKPGPGKSKLDKHKDLIVELLSKGVPKARVARHLETTPANLYNWMRKNGVEVESQI